MESFKETQTDAVEDLELLVGAEYTFVSQELNYCTPSDKKTINSLTQAVKDFDEAFLALKIIQKAAHYKILEQGISHRRDYRYNGMPKDCFHVACAGHITRIANALKTPGINLAEKALLEQRLSNIKTAQAVYLQKQKTVLGITD
jgi:iron uptake system EfeUOB component EfeO/EfeM